MTDPTPSDWWARPIARAYFALAHRLRWCGRENVPRTGPAILAANHQSYFDPIAVSLAAGVPVLYVGLESYYRMPVVGHLMRAFGTIPIPAGSPGHRALSLMLNALSQGAICGIFPEGGRSTDGLFAELHDGVAMLALRTGAPVVPVTLCGAYDAWPIHRPLPRARHISVCFGEPLCAAGAPGDRDRRRITVEIMRRVANGFVPLGRPDMARACLRRLQHRTPEDSPKPPQSVTSP
jgi:1-acyl-sn-glycerol-3-phosphate acyltransferase